MNISHFSPADQLLHHSTSLQALILRQREELPQSVVAKLDEAIGAIDVARGELDGVDSALPSTFDTEVPCWSNSGFASGVLWSMSQPRQPAGFSRLRDELILHKKLDNDALLTAAAVLLEQPKLTTQQSTEFWCSLTSLIPADTEAMQEFLDAFVEGAKAGFAKLTELRRRAAAAKRAQP